MIKIKRIVTCDGGYGADRCARVEEVLATVRTRDVYAAGGVVESIDPELPAGWTHERFGDGHLCPLHKARP